MAIPVGVGEALVGRRELESIITESMITFLPVSHSFTYKLV